MTPAVHRRRGRGLRGARTTPRGAELRLAELIEAAKKEGQLSTTRPTSPSRAGVIKAFNKRFPFVKVEMVRAPGGQLITRIKTEAAPASCSPTWSITPTAA
jgi:iron(III) transport system substrate-binding protein